MRVWLVDDDSGDKADSLSALLQHLQARPGAGLQLVGTCPFQADVAAALRKLVPDFLDLVVLHESAWPAQTALQDLLGLGAGLVVVTPVAQVQRFLALAEQYPLWFVREQPGADELWLALLGAWAGQRRHVQGKTQLVRLQQRLDDRIIIERAKGILVQRLGISEEEAYQRLRGQSRRQRRQIRDIAQSLLDTQSLMSPGEFEQAPPLPDTSDESLEPNDNAPARDKPA